MEWSSLQALARLNQRFYAEHGENFADSRPRLAAGVQQVLAGIAAGARVLEVGCGDGKVGRALARAGVGAYVGLDASEAMLERARRYTLSSLAWKGARDEGKRSRPPTSDIRLPTFAFGLPPPSFPGGSSPAPHPSGGFVFLSADLIAPTWPSVIAGQTFDWALAFAVFHHLPSYALRLRVLRAMAEHLAPGGWVVLSNWQFTRSERAQKRIVPWAEAGLNDADVEPGDYLLTWERKGQHGLRYLHLLDEREAERMAAEAGLQVVETFSADGATGDLSAYILLRDSGL